MSRCYSLASSTLYLTTMLVGSVVVRYRVRLARLVVVESGCFFFIERFYCNHYRELLNSTEGYHFLLIQTLQ